LPRSLQAIVDRALQKNPAKRYADMDAMKAALSAARARLIDQLPPDRGVVATAGATTVLTPRPAELVAAKDQGRAVSGAKRTIPRWWMWTAAAVLAAGLGTAIWWSVTHRSTPPAPTPAGEPATIVLDILPWANIDSIVPKGGGKNLVPVNTVTPDVISLPPGDYHLTASHPKFQKLELDFTAAPGERVELRRSMTGLQPDDAAKLGFRRGP
jgi:hypothetical protein